MRIKIINQSEFDKKMKKNVYLDRKNLIDTLSQHGLCVVDKKQLEYFMTKEEDDLR